MKQFRVRINARRREEESNMMTSAQFPDLKGQSVLVTGGGSGIGAALTEGFVSEGAHRPPARFK